MSSHNGSSSISVPVKGNNLKNDWRKVLLGTMFEFLLGSAQCLVNHSIDPMFWRSISAIRFLNPYFFL